MQLLFGQRPKQGAVFMYMIFMTDQTALKCVLDY